MTHFRVDEWWDVLKPVPHYHQQQHDALLCLNNMEGHESLLRSGVCCAVQAVISFLHGLAFPFLWSVSVQHLLSAGWQPQSHADIPEIEEQHSLKVIGSICCHTGR